jgi:hypothetical protein
MYCGKGNEGFDDNNSNAAVQPMRNVSAYLILGLKDSSLRALTMQLTKSEWWLHHFNRCDEFPPPDGEFLTLCARFSSSLLP